MANPIDEAAIRFGACRLHPRVAASLPGFCKTLAARLERGVSPVTYASYEELLQGFIAGQIELCWMPPVLLAQALAAGGTLLAVPQRAGNAGYRAAILVRKESAVRELNDLRGLRAAWVDRASSSGYLYPRLELVRRLGFGDAPPFSSELFHGATVRAAAAVAAGEADLCACFVTEGAAKDPAQAEADLRRALGPLAERLRALHIGEAIPPDGMVAPAHLPPALRDALSDALLSLHAEPDGQQALSALLQAGELRAPPDAAAFPRAV